MEIQELWLHLLQILTHMLKSDITAAGHGIETGNNFLLINTSEVSESQISQIANRIKEILSK